MSYQVPDQSQVEKSAKALGFQLSATEVASITHLIDGAFGAVHALEGMPDNLPEVTYPRDPGYRPEGEENKYNAWAIKTSIKGAPNGKLAGKTLAIKDNFCVAGMPMTGGASILETYTPEIDATIVQRILDAGGEIAGKAACEYFCLSTTSHTAATGPVHNPHKYGYSAGGSSSGSGALVAAGEVDMAIGTDQGGSVRVPASCCGLVGMKATYGLVPYTGGMTLGRCMDHVGPMTSSVADNALLLEVMAGADGIDPRQTAVAVTPENYTEALGKSIAGRKIAVVEEGFNLPNSDHRVNKQVENALDLFTKLGATVERVSIPIHAAGGPIFLPIAVMNFYELMAGNGAVAQEGLHLNSLLQALGNWHACANEISANVKVMMILGQVLKEQNADALYTKAMNLARSLKAAYNGVLEGYDALLMPTIPIVPPKLPGDDPSVEEVFGCAMAALGNTGQFNLSGHPSMSIPCGTLDDLPVGMMLTGRHFDEMTLYSLAYAFEQVNH